MEVSYATRLQFSRRETSFLAGVTQLNFVNRSDKI